MLRSLMLLSMTAAAPDPGMSALLACYFEQARSSQAEGAAASAFEAAATSACQAQQVAAELAHAKRLIDSGRSPSRAQEEAAEAVRQARSAMVKVYTARQGAK